MLLQLINKYSLGVLRIKMFKIKITQLICFPLSHRQTINLNIQLEQKVPSLRETIDRQ